MPYHSIASTMMIPTEHVKGAVEALRKHIGVSTDASAAEVFTEAGFKVTTLSKGVRVDEHHADGNSFLSFSKLMDVLTPYANGGITYGEKGKTEFGCRYTDDIMFFVDPETVFFHGGTIAGITLNGN